MAVFYQNQLQSLKSNTECPPKTVSTNSEVSNKLKRRRWDNPCSSSSSTSAKPSDQPVDVPPENPDNFMSEFEKAKALVRAKAAAIISGGNIESNSAAFHEEEEKKRKEIEEQKMASELFFFTSDLKVISFKSKFRSVISTKLIKIHTMHLFHLFHFFR